MLQSTASNPNILELLKKLWHHFSRRHKRQFMLLIALMLVSAFAEVMTLGAVLPFIAVLTAPERVLSYPLVSQFAEFLGIQAAGQLHLPLTIGFFVLVLIATAIRILLLWATTRWTLTAGAEVSHLVYKKTLYQPYLVHVERNSSEVISGIATKVNNVVFGVMMSLLTLASSMLLLIAITLSLFVINPQIAAIAGLVFGAGYLATTWATRRRLAQNSKKIAHAQTQLVKTLQDGLGGIRDVLLDGTQTVYCDIYRQTDLPLRVAQCDNTFIAQAPRYVMEALGMLLIAGLAYSLSVQPGGIGVAIPMLGALALGAQRLLPYLQQAYGAWISIAGNEGALKDVVDLLDQHVSDEMLQPVTAPLPFEKFIQFKSIKFRYPNTDRWVLNDVSFEIPKGSRIGLVGSTGSGKSTTIDLLMGLLSSTEGQICIDGQPLDAKSVRAWQRTLAHVPQSIYLADASLAENIAFGVPPSLIDLEQVKMAAHQSQIGSFIENSEHGYNALIGERGIRLSGGQRQRIGIARALYKQASVLVFDEATSALDNATEQSVMQTIDSLGRELTIIIIAHRLTTVQGCDFIIQLDHGKISGCGSYQELLATNQHFKSMVEAASHTQ